MNNFAFNMTPCDIAEITGETSRFLLHISLVHIVSCIIDRSESFFGKQVIKTLFVTAIAIILYHVLIKKFIEPKLKKIRSICDTNHIETKYIKIPKKKNEKKSRKSKRSEDTNKSEY